MLACVNMQTADAQNIESLVSPGNVATSHAEAEAECSSCHKRFARSEQNNLCIECHEDVGKDISSEIGFHGRSADARTGECAACHTDHKGRGMDIIDLDESTFDHLITDFELLGKHLEVDCVDCHEPSDKHREASGDCISCHLEDDVHKEVLGTECADCHSETDWIDITYDHDTTDFSLVGKHQEADCLSCHETDSFEDTSDTCFGCHAEDDAHEGRSGDQCENCHNPTSWSDSSFDHGRDTDFALEWRHGELTCDDCHSDDPFVDELETECVGCHLEDDAHDKHRGQDCTGCHSPKEWAESTFDHGRDTDYLLGGSHQTVVCTDCHIDPIFDASPETNCVSCHLDDDVHEGSKDAQCNGCHDEVTWEEAPYFDHDLAQFPLLGDHDNVECETCHLSQVFTDVDTECVACHDDDDDDPHRGNFADNCGSCHNPVAWDLWLFDHDTQTDFILDGAHLDVACDDCHRSSLAAMRNTGDNCGGCHRPDDDHDGEFGPDCGRCHGDNTFKDVRSLQ